MSQRNTTVDVVRGFAMLLVVLGHTMSGVTSDFENSLLFQMIWTLQMPLFIIISGYVTRYSRPLTTAGELWGFVKKRSLAYLLPWCVWTFVVRGLIVGQTSFFNPGYLLWTMDAGYWFLISIWTINMIFGVADYFRNKLKQRCFDCAQHDIKESLVGNVAVQLMFCALGMVILAGVGLWLGLSFFCIKLTLYYLPIYLLGYVYGQLQERLMAVRWSSVAVNWTIVLALGIWLTCISRFDFYSGADSAVMILCRFVVSILGCVAVIGLFTASCKSGGVLRLCGKYSLEIYLSHYLFLSLIPLMPVMEKPMLMTMQGGVVLAVNFLLTVGLTGVIVLLVNKNRLLNFLLFAKRGA